MYKIIIKLICLALCYTGFSQDTKEIPLTLTESIEIAIKNNLDLQSSKLLENRSKVNFRQSKADLLPNLDANYNLGISAGRSIDPFTNTIVNREFTFSNAGLNLNAVVFNGFRLLNEIKRNKLNLQASQMEVEAVRQNLILNVTLAYLRVLNNQDLVQLAENRLATTMEQVNRLETLYREEVGNPADFTDIKGQVAFDRTGVIQAENALKESVLSLTQLLNIDYEITLEGVVLLAELQKVTYTPEQVFEEAQQNLATFKADELRIDAAKKGIHVARSSYIPTFSIFARLNTNYSSAAQIFIETETNQIQTGDFVTINDQQFPVFTNRTNFRGEEIAYLDQFENNLNSLVGVAVSIPIFNNLEVRNNVALQKINHQESIIALEDTKLQFKQAIEQAHNDMEAAFRRYNILQEQVAAYEESFRINEIRFNSGVSNIVEYTISKNNLDNARINLANAMYEYLLRVRVLEYYRGVS